MITFGGCKRFRSGISACIYLIFLEMVRDRYVVKKTHLIIALEYGIVINNIILNRFNLYYAFSAEFT